MMGFRCFIEECVGKGMMMQTFQDGFEVEPFVV
jgi:hypothetical protein